MAKLYSFLHPARRRVQTDVSGETITQQEFARDCDINYLVEKHMRSGLPFPVGPENYADVSDVVDFQAAHDIINNAREKWYGLDAKIRRAFGDRVENFLTALHDPDQYDDLVRLKVFKKAAGKAQGDIQEGGGATSPKVDPPEPKKGPSQGSGGPASAGGAKAPGTGAT